MSAFDVEPSVAVSVVMPCLNEVETLESCVTKALRSIASLGMNGEVVVADNGSTDGSQALASKSGARVVDVKEKGYGSALMGGILAARGKYVIMGDADDSYDFTLLSPFIEKLEQGHDLVLGNRFLGGIRPGAMPPLHRYLGNPVLTGIGKLLFKSPVGDFHCGLRAFRRSSVLQLDLRTTGMEFASEMIVKATLQRLKITEVPTILSPDGRSRPPHLRSWRDGWRHLRFLLLYSPRWLFLWPGLALILAGLTVGGFLVQKPWQFDGVQFDVHTLLYAGLAVIVGYQSVTFAIFTKVFAMTEGLLPQDANFNNLTKYVRLEVGLFVGIVLVLLGLVGSAYAISSWQLNSFGNMNPQITLRTVIPSVVAIALGCQTILSSFFLSVLGLSRKN